MLASRFIRCSQSRPFHRTITTLPSNPYIRAFPSSSPNRYVLTYLDTDPPNLDLAIGTTTTVPPTPSSFSENHRFLSILNDVLARHAQNDKDLISQAHAFASPGGVTLGSGGAFFQQQGRKQPASRSSSSKMGGGGGAAGSGAGGASGQGGAGGGGVGGWVHLSDSRNPPDFGRIAWPEDILGSVEVDSYGTIVGNFQPSGTYRIVTNEGILGLSTFLREKLVEHLKSEEAKT